MKEKLLWGGLVFLTVYMVVPWVLTRIAGWGVRRRGSGDRQIALTFDDGPDPIYTPLLLDLLKHHGLKATFFVLGERAEKYPELVKRIFREGHQIGVHNYRHISNWLLAPWTVRRDHVDRSSFIVQKITGERPVCYRPPWGILNIFDLFLRKHYDIVLWSAMPRDWRKKTGAKKLKERLLKHVKGGSVVLLHDSGQTFGADPDAPQEMLAALREAIPEWKRQQYEFVRIDEMFGKRKPSAVPSLSVTKQLIVSIWMLWERCFVKLFHIVPIDRNNPFLQLRVREYTGDQTLVLGDGEQIKKGDRIIELHFNNDLLLEMGLDSRSSLHLAIQMIRRTQQLMPKLIKLIQTDPQFRDVKGLYGISLIHRGPEQFGFTVIDMPKGLFSTVTSIYLRFLLFVIHPEGKERLKTRSEQLVPKIIAISRKELLNRYIA